MRLISFGCSFTYGYGLKDCYVPSTNGCGPISSQFAWPQLLANKIGVESVNQARPGSSNKEIINTILNFDFVKDDIVVIMWSFLERSCIIRPDAVRAIIPADDDATNFYKEFFEEYDQYCELIRNANYAKLLFKNLNIVNKHLHVDSKILKYEKLSWDNVMFSEINMSDLRAKHPYALDVKYGNPHPGELAHVECADLLFNEMKKENLI